MTKLNILLSGIVASTFLSCVPAANNTQATQDLRTIISDESTTTQTIYGEVQGYKDGNVFAFKGIPYAKAARFMPPQDPDKHEGVKIHRMFGPKAPQANSLNWHYRYNDNDFAFQAFLEPMDEQHCHVLNIWTNGLNDGKKRPVFVWFHGGGYSGGSGSEWPCYEGHALAQKGDIVVVTVNHRLNVLGYIDMRGLGGKYAESVNLGQQDLVKALEWVHKNIANFGGDPGCVTIGGQSGGGGKVSNLMAMPSARGLFHRAIVQSGSSLRFGEGESTKAFGLLFAKQLGVTPGHTEKLDSFTYEELNEAYRKASREAKGVLFSGQSPTVDGKYIVEAPIAPELSKDIPLLVGTNLYEFNYQASKLGTTMEEAKEILSKRLGNKLDAYIQTYKKIFPDMEPRDLVNTEFNFRKGAVAQANAKSAQQGANVYSYLFTWKPLGSDLGPCHTIELPFVFNNIMLQREMTRGTPDAYKMADVISSAWIQFIKTGDPNTPSLPTWEPYTEENGAVMFLDNNSHMVYGHDKALEEYAPNGRGY